MSLVCAHPRDNQSDFVLAPLYHWVDDPVTMTMVLSGDAIAAWTDRIQGNVMHRGGFPTLNDGVDVRYANYFQTNSPVSGFRSYASVSYFRNATYQYPILCDSSHYAYCGNPVGGTLFSATYANLVVQQTHIYSSTGYKGLGNTTINTYLFDRWEILMVCSPVTLPAFNRFGRDRTSWEFNGKIREILFFAEDLHANATLRGRVLSYLSKRMIA
jgi:hypothetical protein